jgi:hypothetical protein
MTCYAEVFPLENEKPELPEDAIGPFLTPGRLPYRSPALVEYGNVSKLTEGNNGSIPDSNNMNSSMMGMCL